MSLIRILPDDVKIDTVPGETVLAAALRAGVPHLHLCGGHAHCSTCRVEVRDGEDGCAPPTEAERRIAEQLRFPPHLRLACQTVVDGPMTVRRLVLDAHDARLVDRRQRDSEATASAGEERELAILFADIRGFTAFSERLPPYDVIHVLNRYFQAAGEVVERQGGQIDNYMGNGFMALFGLHGEADSACLRAVGAALALIDAVAALQPYLLTAFGQTFDVGVGIHYGCAVVGNVGAAGRERVTAIGDAVNLASRIEAANKRFGTRLLVSEQTWTQLAGRAQIGAIHETALPGKSGSYRLIEVRGLRAD
ncbi:adenylate/guanylate cyclase domain-containing protein [Tahibacter caeni]|uniref:adenylate/guanylate cyclase domain-containing protein n=1 Tax=Tahibacter caeni TaxID=1453545 RepID=UPI002147CFE4|nr:adenylate/guanylate cyclase domain-containing protein [Tahibacter caeni]